MQQSWSPAALSKRDSATQVFFCEYSEPFRNSFFNRTTPVAAVELRFSIRKELKNRKLVERLISLALIGLLYVQIPEPASRWTRSIFWSIFQSFVFGFYYRKIFKTRSRWRFDDDSPCGLSVTGDIKIYQCHMIKR